MAPYLQLSGQAMVDLKLRFQSDLLKVKEGRGGGGLENERDPKKQVQKVLKLIN